MKQDVFKIYVDQLHDGHHEEIDEKVPCDFLDVVEKDLYFKNDVTIKGEVYLAGEMLVLHVDLAAIAIMPCSICNESVEVKIQLPAFYLAQPLDEIKSGVFDYKNSVRDAILLEVPYLAECNEGHCIKRKDIEKYLTSPQKQQDEGYRPFADL